MKTTTATGFAKVEWTSGNRGAMVSVMAESKGLRPTCTGRWIGRVEVCLGQKRAVSKRAVFATRDEAAAFASIAVTKALAMTQAA